MTTLRLIWTHAHGRDRWMRVLMCVIAVLVLMAVPAQQAGAAAQFTLWPAQFAYGTPSGDFTWNSTMFGLRFDEPLGPFVGLQTNLRYGPAANLTFPGRHLQVTTGTHGWLTPSSTWACALDLWGSVRSAGTAGSFSMRKGRRPQTTSCCGVLPAGWVWKPRWRPLEALRCGEPTRGSPR